MGSCAPRLQCPPTRIEPPRATATALRDMRSHPCGVVEAEISESVATVVHDDSPPLLETSLAPLPESSASRLPSGVTASASGARTRPSGSTPVVQIDPGALDAATGEKPSEKDGTTPEVTDDPGPGAASTPPLVAIPGGVASTQWRPERPKSSQKVFTGSERIPIGNAAHGVVPLFDEALNGTTNVAAVRAGDPHAERAAEASVATVSRARDLAATWRRVIGRRGARALNWVSSRGPGHSESTRWTSSTTSVESDEPRAEVPPGSAVKIDRTRPVGLMTKMMSSCAAIAPAVLAETLTP